MKRFFRIIPTLLLKNNGVVKTKQFKYPRYIGDPINIIKIFNEKEADEVCILNIDDVRHQVSPNYDHIEEIVSEAFMPVAYGGGIKNVNEVERLFKIGIEKIVINSFAVQNIEFVKEISNIFGSQSIVVSLDIKKNLFGKYIIFTQSGTKKEIIDFESYLEIIQNNGAGEIIINNIDRDGLMRGYDIKLAKLANSKLKIPFTFLGGAGKKEDLIEAIEVGASGVSAGSLFIYKGAHNAVLVSYIKNEELFTDNN